MQVKPVAPESPQVLKMREKLKKKLDGEGVTPAKIQQAVAAMKDQLHKWERIPVQKKSMKLFDGNASSADPSKKVQELMNKIRTGELA